MRVESKKTTKLEWTKPEMVKSAIGGVTNAAVTNAGDGGSCNS